MFTLWPCRFPLKKLLTNDPLVYCLVVEGYDLVLGELDVLCRRGLLPPEVSTADDDERF